jgi:predicted DNA-binding transcriptional regulator AlpA
MARLKPSDLRDWPRGLKPELAAAYVGLSVSTIHRMRAEGQFPRPITVARGRIVWPRETLDRSTIRPAAALMGWIGQTLRS